jgi:CubicO group peptidase (beta-lactamase class C family)
MAHIEGHCDPRFDQLKATLEAQLTSGNELGAAIVVNIDGKNVVDIWGGYSDEGQTQPWTKDTIVNVWSCTKNVAALAVLIQIDRGVLDLEAPVAKYWPEFAQNGKDKVLIRHILSHTSGVAGWEDPITFEEVCDASTSVDRLAKQAPWWEPGTAFGYHANNM